MTNQTTPFTVAAAQAAPFFLDRDKTVDKACELIKEAGKNNAKLIVFPEAFISGYPDWVWLVPNGNGSLLNELYTELVNNAVSIPDDSTQQLCQAAKEAGIHVAMGVHEINTESSGASLFNTILYIDDQGEILGKHRKLIPTGGERLIWSQGDGSTLQPTKHLLANWGDYYVGKTLCPWPDNPCTFKASRSMLRQPGTPAKIGY